ncbi:hypothetical protein GGI25_002666 [Coemansia spiralis]|uniref:Tyrosine specific protein phosphatases domain-containing protein n=2 Tax=Coemansia TaxID=4863 RepID=A0A9W8KY92_9FUNG|nr:protein-tyrosine phosphatase-like protein [Coemansia spiralis]KAJ1992896.1 hypothetical protein EDC05_002528 [Coemansia umbellata]KAJ2622830.1 hypothetical protein GGI26_002937 [Coemansia sp. RSA 1358]KAJ2678023.1 hypothetical protein GGI25_002666 [Coemansia spiralis]
MSGDTVHWPRPPTFGETPIRLCVPIWTHEDRYAGQPIIPHLLLGPYHLVRKREFLEQNRIEHILCIRDPSELRFLRATDATAAFTFMDVPADVTKVSIIPYFVQANQWLAQVIAREQNVLVCCSDGIDKSSAFVAAYLMSTYGLKALDAMTFILNQRYCATPSANGYRIKLAEYEPICAAQRSAACKEDGADGLKNSRKRVDEEEAGGDEMNSENSPQNGNSGRKVASFSYKRAR